MDANIKVRYNNIRLFGKVCQWHCYEKTKDFDEFLMQPSFSSDNFGLGKPIRSLIDGNFNTNKSLNVKTE